MILLGQRELVARWVCSQIRDMGVPPEKDYEAIGAIDRDGRLIGGVVYTEYRELPDGTHDIRMSAAGHGLWLTRGNLRVFFGYPFLQLGCSRVTTLAAKANRRARNLNERLGFRHEGTIRGCFGVGKDGILYGMLKAECRWTGDNRSGQESTESAKSGEGGRCSDREQQGNGCL